MKNLLWIVLVIISLTIFGFSVSKKIAFKQNVSGYLKRAADASTIDLANEELTKAIDYLEANNMTSGYTSILYETPDEDIGFWYRNLKASQNELANLKSESALEKTNVLIKLRETLLDSGEKSKVTIPDGLAVYPNNALWAALMWFALACGLAGFGLMLKEIGEAEKRYNERKKLQNDEI